MEIKNQQLVARIAEKLKLSSFLKIEVLMICSRFVSE